MPVYKKISEKTGKESWYCSFYGPDSTGHRKKYKEEGFKLRREALEYERHFLEKLSTEPTVLFEIVAENYLEYIKTHRSETTYTRYQENYNSTLAPIFKGNRINTITPAHVREWQNGQIKKGYSQKTIILRRSILSGIFNYAMTYNGLEKNPCKLVESPPDDPQQPEATDTDKDKIHYWTPEQFKIAMNHEKNYKYKVLLTLLFYSGLRIGEALALTPADIDFDNNTLSVTKTKIRLTIRNNDAEPPKNQNRIHPPKRKASRRTISLPPKLTTLIAEYIDKAGIEKSNQLLFEHTTDYNTRIHFKTLIQKAELPKIKIHDLRHSHASMLINMDFNPIVIRDRLGHKSIQTTLDIYSHLFPQKEKETADKLNDVMD